MSRANGGQPPGQTIAETKSVKPARVAQRKSFLAVVSCAVLTASLSSGQNAARAADAADIGSGAKAVVANPADAASGIETVEIIAKRNDLYDVLPDRITDSVFGTDLTLAETPRSVTLIESPLISLLGIRSVDDFVNVTPGTFTGAYFGVPGAVDVRGDIADNFFRGFRRVENRGNFPTSVEAADYVEIIKGPPPAIYGGGKVGGILNFVPKGPSDKDGNLIDTPVGLVSLTEGTYGQNAADLEGGLPFDIAGYHSAVYVSVQGEDSESYYKNIYTKNLLVQAAAKTIFNNRFFIEYGGMAQLSNVNQSLGWNRVTQALINSNGKEYLSGQPALNLDTNHDGYLEPSEVNAYQLNQFAFANPFPYYALTPLQRAAFALNPATVHYTTLSHRTVMAESSDFNKSQVYTGYFDLDYVLGDGWLVKNQSFYDQMNNLKYSSYGFTADYHNIVFENKTTVSGAFTPADWLVVSPVGGISWREAGGRERAAQDIYSLIDRRDLSVGATGNDRFQCACDPSSNIPYNWDEDGRYTDAAVFGVIQATMFDRLTAILGGRVDSYHVTVTGTDNFGVYSSPKDSKTAASYNTSLLYKVLPAINLYTTYATSDFIELGQGGIVAAPNVASHNWVQPSNLLEFGIKGYLDEGRFYFNVVHYNQEKSSYDSIAGTFDQYKSSGVELEGHYALTKELSFVGTATWQKTTQLNAPFFIAIPPGVLGLDPTLIYGGKFSGVGSLIGYYGPTEVPAPDTTFSLNGIYTSEQGWGASVGFTHVSSMWANYTESVRLASYTVVRGALFYNFGPWSIQLNGDNLLNAQYFRPQSLFNETLVSPSIGRTLSLKVTRRI